LIKNVDRIQSEVKAAIYKWGIAKDSKNRDIFAY
jgi:meiotically up-regulated gene 157 (Mug157) protein